jgi:hypothetical protein
VVAVSLTLQFLLELAALAAYGYWGANTGSSTAVHVVLAIAAPLAAAVVWGLFGSPRAPFHLAGIWRIMLEVAFFGLAAVALIVAGQVVLGVVFAVVVAANIVLLNALGHGDFEAG